VALFNQLNEARYSVMPRSLLGLEESEGVVSVAPEIMPVFVVEDDRPEHAWKKQERLCVHRHREAAGGAGNESGVALLLATDSNGSRSAWMRP
jgi:hypothetical protein